MSMPLYRDGVRETLAAELADAPARIGGWRGFLFLAGFAGVLGVYFPWSLGQDFMDPFFQIVYACSAPLFQSQITIASFTEDKSRRMLEGWWEAPCPQPEFLLGKIAATAIAGFAGALCLYALSLATLTIVHGNGQLLVPGASFLIPLLAIGAAFSIFSANVGATLALRVQTPTEARRSVRTVFLAVLVGIAVLGPYAPPVVKGWIASAFLPESLPWVATGAIALLIVLSYALWRWCLDRIQSAKPVGAR
ncbi:MAG: hypothetical protein ABI972_15425 [Acidobacteriota bacterium]